MKNYFFGRYSGPLIALGGLVAVACLASTGYINRLQADLARAVRYDAAGREAAVDLQVQLRHLRVHSLVFVADPSDARKEVVRADLTRIDAALAALRQAASDPDDACLVDTIERDYATYRERLGLSSLPSTTRSLEDLVRWSDDHHMSDLLVPCRELADRQRDRMNLGLARTESQTAWAGRVLLGLSVVGVFAGLLSGFSTARGLNRKVARLSVRVQAVQAQLDQDVGAMTVDRPDLGDLDDQLEQVVGRVKEVCQRLQEQERDLLRADQLAAVGSLAAGVAHEIRNPLTGVKLLLQAATRAQGTTPLTPERMILLLQEVGRIERTVQGLVEFARTPPPDRHRYDFRKLATQATEAARGRADAKQVALWLEIPQISILVTVDGDQMLSLLSNLLSNAIEAASPGGEVGMRVTTGSGETLRVEVTDTGPGIDPTIEKRLFTPFATTKPTGTGLGLTIARRVAMDHGGKLTASNLPEGGACFTFSLPTMENSYVETSGSR